jgi:uncharacterized protein
LGTARTRAESTSSTKWTPTTFPHGAKAAKVRPRTARCSALPTIGPKVIDILAIAAWSGEAQAPSADTKSAKARQFLELSGAGTLGVQMMGQMLPALKQMAPDAPESFWQEFMSEVRPESLIDLIVPIYAKHFEEAELDELIAFYASPIGRKTVERLPAITAESMSVGQAWGEAIAKRAIERLKASGHTSSS